LRRTSNFDRSVKVTKTLPLNGGVLGVHKDKMISTAHKTNSLLTCTPADFLQPGRLPPFFSRSARICIYKKPWVSENGLFSQDAVIFS